MLNTGSVCTKCHRRAAFVDEAGMCTDCMEADAAAEMVDKVAQAMLVAWTGSVGSNAAPLERQPANIADRFRITARAAIRAMTASEPPFAS